MNSANGNALSRLVWLALLGCAGSVALADAGRAGTPSQEPDLSRWASEPFTLAAEPAPEASAKAQSDAELAKKLQNPVADLISVPFQFNWDTGVGSRGADKYTLNIQPVVPISISEDWNVIIRTIMPVVYQESIAEGVDSRFGFGDIVQSFFFSPKAPVGDGWIVGAGPVFLWPTATDDTLGTQKWGVGPTAVILKQESGWTYGLLANHIWSYAGDDDRKSVNLTFVQPFVSYTFKTLTTVVLNTESTYDWDESQWTVPINLQVNQMLKIGRQPVQIGVGGRYYADGPDGTPEWGLRLNFILLFPK